MSKKLILVFTLLITWPKMGYAYLDPGSGSIIFQIIMASIISTLVAIRVFWTNIKSFFGFRGSHVEVEEEMQDPPSKS